MPLRSEAYHTIRLLCASEIWQHMSVSSPGEPNVARTFLEDLRHTPLGTLGGHFGTLLGTLFFVFFFCFHFTRSLSAYAFDRKVRYRRGDSCGSVF